MVHTKTENGVFNGIPSFLYVYCDDLVCTTSSVGGRRVAQESKRLVVVSVAEAREAQTSLLWQEPGKYKAMMFFPMFYWGGLLDLSLVFAPCHQNLTEELCVELLPSVGPPRKRATDRLQKMVAHWNIEIWKWLPIGTSRWNTRWKSCYWKWLPIGALKSRNGCPLEHPDETHGEKVVTRNGLPR